MLAGTLRRGSGMTGVGGCCCVAPVVIGFSAGGIWFCALSRSRAFGAGFGTGTVCAEEDVTPAATEAATSSASARGVMLCFFMRTSGLPFWRVIPLSCRPLLPRFGLVEVSFFREIMLQMRLESVPAALLVADEDFALSGVIRRAHNAFQFHAFHQRSGAVVADLQAALDVGGRGLLVAFDDRDRLLEQIAAFAAHAGAVEHGAAVFLGRLFRGDRFEIFRRA